MAEKSNSDVPNSASGATSRISFAFARPVATPRPRGAIAEEEEVIEEPEYITEMVGTTVVRYGTFAFLFRFLSFCFGCFESRQFLQLYFCWFLVGFPRPATGANFASLFPPSLHFPFAPPDVG